MRLRINKLMPINKAAWTLLVQQQGIGIVENLKTRRRSLCEALTEPWRESDTSCPQ